MRPLPEIRIRRIVLGTRDLFACGHEQAAPSRSISMKHFATMRRLSSITASSAYPEPVEGPNCPSGEENQSANIRSLHEIALNLAMTCLCLSAQAGRRLIFVIASVDHSTEREPHFTIQRTSGTLRSEQVDDFEC